MDLFLPVHIYIEKNLSKGTNGIKQNVSHENTPFSDTIFRAHLRGLLMRGLSLCEVTSAIRRMWNAEFKYLAR